MEIEDLTIKQAREIAELFGEINKPDSSSNLLNTYKGKYVIVRSRNEGINAGIVKELDQTCIILKDARRIWYHKPKDKKTSWYEGVSISGLSDDSKISVPVEEKAIIEDYSLTLCSDEAKKSISGHKTTETIC